ncbi:MAG TPA: hypothetical protein V6C58_14105 [Allocoleopsis sp.]
MTKQTDSTETYKMTGNVSIFPSIDGREPGNLECTGTIYADSFIENTEGNGVSIENVEIKDSYITVNEISTPSNPVSGKQRIYVDQSDGVLKSKKSDGSVKSFNPMTTKGDLIGHTGTTESRVPISYNKFLVSDSSASTGLSWKSLSDSGFFKICIIYDLKSTGTNGGTFPSNQWITRTLNTIERSHSEDTDITLSDNVLTINQGLYLFECSSPAFRVEAHCIRLFNITDNTVQAIGSSEYSGSLANTQTRSSSLHTLLNLTSTKQYRIEHRNTNSLTAFNTGLGVASGIQNEIYTVCTITRIG